MTLEIPILTMLSIWLQVVCFLSAFSPIFSAVASPSSPTFTLRPLGAGKDDTDQVSTCPSIAVCAHLPEHLWDFFPTRWRLPFPNVAISVQQCLKQENTISLGKHVHERSTRTSHDLICIRKMTWDLVSSRVDLHGSLSVSFFWRCCLERRRNLRIL